MRRPRRILRLDHSPILREFSLEELTFLTLHARYGPIVRSELAANLLGFGSENELRRSIKDGELRLEIFRLPGRLKKTFVAAIPLAKALVNRGVQLPDQAIPETWSFSADDTSGPEILMLGRALSAAQFRTMTLHELTALRMHARYGPLITSAKAAELLSYASGRALINAIHDGRGPITLVVPEGRNKAFAATRAVAWVLADIAVAHEAMAKSAHDAPAK